MRLMVTNWSVECQTVKLTGPATMLTNWSLMVLGFSEISALAFALGNETDLARVTKCEQD